MTGSIYFREQAQRVYLGFMIFLLVIVFLLNHSNQNSSQSMATLLLLLSPGLLLLKLKPLPLELKAYIAATATMFIYALLLFFHHQISEVAFSTMRGLSFYLLAPAAVLTLWRLSPSRHGLFIIMLGGTLFSMYPVIRELLSYGQTHRGNLSAHPIFWGNVCLTTGVVAFILSRDTCISWRFTRLLGWFSLSCAAIASFWSLTRGGWLSIPAALALLYLLKLINTKHLTALLITVVIAFSFSSSLQNRVLETFNHFKGGISLDGSTSLRIQMWDVSLDALQHNVLIGYGLDGFSRQNSEEKQAGKLNFYFDHAHNEYFEILASRGLIGMAIFLFMVGTLALTYYKHRHSIYAKAGLIALTQYLIYSLSETFFTAKFTIMYFIVLHSFLLVAIHKEEQSQVRAA